MPSRKHSPAPDNAPDRKIDPKTRPPATPGVKKTGGRPSPHEGFFESREKEPTAFDIMGIRPTRNFSNGRLEWTVPGDQVELFRQHFHVQNNRVIYRGRLEPNKQEPDAPPQDDAAEETQDETPVQA